MFDWGGFLGGLGGLFGGASGLFGGGGGSAKKANKLAKKALKWQKFWDTNRVRLTVADAKAAGIHPLAALGGSFGGSSVQSPGLVPEGQSSWGDNVGDVFGSLGQIAGAFSERGESKLPDYKSYGAHRAEWARAQQDRDLDVAFKKASIEEVRSRSMLNAARMASIGAAPPTTVVNNPDAAGRLITPFGTLKYSRNSDAQDAENRYGELGSIVQGVTNFFSDLRHTNYPPPRRVYTPRRYDSGADFGPMP